MSAFLQGMTVLDVDGQVRTLSDAWSDRPVWLAFIRHFG
jgi:hypothetical protein